MSNVAAKQPIDLSLMASCDKNQQLRDAVQAYVSDAGAHFQSFVASPALRLRKTAAGAMSGFVACVSEHAPLSGSEAEAVATSKTGTGVSWFALDEDALHENESLKGLIGELKARTMGKTGAAIPLTKTGAYVTMFTYHDEEEHVNRHAILVRANDRRAASKLQQRVSAAHAAGTPVTLGRLLNDENGMYDEVIRRSRAAREKIASSWAASHGIVLANGGKAAGSFDTHVTVPSAVAPKHGGAADAVASTGRPVRAYLIYNDVADPASAHNGVLVWQGPFGVWHMRGAEHVTGEGKSSHSWNSSRGNRPSMYPTTTGLWGGPGTGRAAAKHAGSNEKIADIAAKRIAWDGRVAGYNPRVNEIFNGLDGETLRWMQQLGSAPGGPVSKTDWHLVAAVMPGIDTRRSGLDELVDVAERSGEPSLAVHATSPVVHQLVDAWPSLRNEPSVRAAHGSNGNKEEEEAAAAGPSLAQLFANELPEERALDIKSEVLRALHKQQQKSAHKHSGKSAASGSEE